MSRFANVTPSWAGHTGPMSTKEQDMFPWGRVVAVHGLGEHEIIEYLDRNRDGCSILKSIGTEHSFHVNGRGCCYPSLDEAIVGAIAQKYDGANSQAGRLFCKAIGMYDKKEPK